MSVVQYVIIGVLPRVYQTSVTCDATMLHEFVSPTCAGVSDWYMVTLCVFSHTTGKGS